MRRRGWGVTSFKSYSELFRYSECIGYNRATFMAITIGQQLGSYEIVSQIGSGGMGEEGTGLSDNWGGAAWEKCTRCLTQYSMKRSRSKHSGRTRQPTALPSPE